MRSVMNIESFDRTSEASKINLDDELFYLSLFDKSIHLSLRVTTKQPRAFSDFECRCCESQVIFHLQYERHIVNTVLV